MDSPIKWHGGKHYLAPKLWEIAKTTPHVHRVEPYGGSMAFTLATEPEGYSEVINDTNGGLMNFWFCLQHPKEFEHFKRRCEATPFSKECFQRAQAWMRREDTTCAEWAWAFFVQCRQSMAGRNKDFAPLSRKRTRRGMNEQASAWITSIDGLQPVHQRLQRIVVLNDDAITVMRQQDGSGVLFYLDPTYLQEVRTAPKVYGDYEMTVEDHRLLLSDCAQMQGKFMLSGYHSELYDSFAATHGWRCHTFDLPNNAASGDEKKRMTECVWTNF